MPICLLLRVLLLVALVSAGATPVRAQVSAATAAGRATAALEALRANDLRVESIGFALATDALPLCQNGVPRSGILVQLASLFDAEIRADAVALFHLDRGPAITGVVSGSAADRAGVRAGDRLLAINGAEAVDLVPPTSRARIEGYTALIAWIDAALEKGPIRLKLERDGRVFEISYAGDSGCPSLFQVTLSRSLNAQADGNTVAISEEIIAYTIDDDELAFVIGHELAHNILRHRERLDRDHVERGVLRSFGRNPALIRATEAEADYYGVYLAARAGYDAQAAARFWARLARRHRLRFLSDHTHPADPQRIAMLTATAAEIAARRAASQPLLPDYPAFAAARR